MQVFISWSGERSRVIAETLRTWLPRVIQTLKPWMSQEDIQAGSRWLAEVSSLLDSSQVGILCITPENQHNPWLLFEAGALSKSLGQSRVCPLLFDMTPGQLSGPVTQFQAYTLDQQGILRVLQTLNSLLDGASIAESDLHAIVSVWWPHLEKELDSIGRSPVATASRPIQEQLDELLNLTREQLRRENLRLEASKSRDAHFDSLLSMMDKSVDQMATIQARAKKVAKGYDSSFASIVQRLQALDSDSPDMMKGLVELMTSGSELPSIEVDFEGLRSMSKAMQQLSEEQRGHLEAIVNKPEAADEVTKDAK